MTNGNGKDGLVSADRSLLLVIDLQSRLMPAIHDAKTVLANTHTLIDAAKLCSVPACVTEQNPAGLGKSVTEIADYGLPTLEKTFFDASREPAFDGFLPEDRNEIVVAGCEAHVCVMQTVSGLLAGGRQVFIVSDAVGSRTSSNRQAAVQRMVRAGAEPVTTEMVVFEWLRHSDHPGFRDAIALVK